MLWQYRMELIIISMYFREHNASRRMIHRIIVTADSLTELQIEDMTVTHSQMSAGEYEAIRSDLFYKRC